MQKLTNFNLLHTQKKSACLLSVLLSFGANPKKQKTTNLRPNEKILHTQNFTQIFLKNLAVQIFWVYFLKLALVNLLRRAKFTTRICL